MLIVPDRWRMLFVLFLARTAMAYQFQTIPSDGPLLIEHLGLGFTQLGTLIGLYMLPGIVIALPGGMLAQRFGAERVVLSGLALMAAGGALMGAESIPLIFAGRLISGLGAVFLNVLMTKMVADWFSGRDITAAMALFVSSWPLGIALGLITFPPLAAASGWASVMYVAAAAVLICLVLVALIYRAPADLPAQTGGGLQIDLSRREWMLISLAGFIWGSFNAGYIVLISFLPDLFVARGYSLADASRIVSVLAFVVIFTVPLAGYFAEYLKRPNLMMLSGLSAVAVAATVLAGVGAPAIPFAVIVIIIGLPPGPMMALAAESLRPKNRSTGMGVFYTWHFAAMAVLPAVAGTARDISGSAAAPILFAAATMAAAALAVIAFRLVQNRLGRV
jgi:cyanate permease